MNLLSNTGLHSVRENVRVNALESFEYFSNSVLGIGLADHLCQYTQDVFNDRESCTIPTLCPKALQVALAAWLRCKGVEVLVVNSLHEHEILRWLELGQEDIDHPLLSAVFEVNKEGLHVQWIEMEAEKCA